MYCIPSALTVCQLSFSSLATSEIDACRQRRPTKIRKALGVERIVCQKVDLLSLHLAVPATIDAPHLQLKQYSHVPAGQVTHLPDFAVVPPHLAAATASTRCFFDRRFNVTMRTFGSPKTPRTSGAARNPSNEYVSQSSRRRFDILAIGHLCQILNSAKMQNIPEIPRLMTFQALKLTHSILRRPFLFSASLLVGLQPYVRAIVLRPSNLNQCPLALACP